MQRSDKRFPNETIASGTKWYGDGSSGSAWWFVRGQMDDEDFRFYCESHGIDYYYGGPGKGFQDKPRMKTSKSYTLIRQHIGMDI